MSRRLNCWEYTNCGMEPGGLFAKTHGSCPVAKMMKFDGINGGQGAGRFCWAVKNRSGNAGLPCRNHRLSCTNCAFYRRVHCEEEDGIVEAKREAAGGSKSVVCE